MRWQSLIGGAIGLALPTLTAAVGNNELHLPPYDFLMGNHIDSHMEDKLQTDGSLRGRLYIYFTGETDEASGLLVARHPRGAGEHNEECGVDPIECVVGWHVRAVPAEAVFISHSGVNGDDHPTWLINAVKGFPSRVVIPTSIGLPLPAAMSGGTRSLLNVMLRWLGCWKGMLLQGAWGWMMA